MSIYFRVSKSVPTLTFFATIIGLFGCDGSQFASSKDGKKNSSNGGQASLDEKQPNDGATDDENTKSLAPQPLSGAFLTCATVSPQEAGLGIDQNTQPVGCALVVGNNKKADRGSAQFILTLNRNSSESIPIETHNAPETSHWHIYASAPKSIDEGSYFHMSVLPGVRIDRPDFPVSGLEAKTTKIPDTTTSPGNRSDSQPLPDNSTSHPASPSNLLSSASWPYTPFAAAKDFFNVITLCNNGSVLSEPTFSVTIPLDSFHAKIVKQSMDVSTLICAAKINFNSTAATAVEKDGCLFMDVKDASDLGHKIYIFSKADQDSQKLNLETLKTHTDSMKPCAI